MGREDVSRTDYSIWFPLDNQTSTRLGTGAVGSGFESAETTADEGGWGKLAGWGGGCLLGSVPAWMAAKSDELFGSDVALRWR